MRLRRNSKRPCLRRFEAGSSPHKKDPSLHANRHVDVSKELLTATSRGFAQALTQPELTLSRNTRKRWQTRFLSQVDSPQCPASLSLGNAYAGILGDHLFVEGNAQARRVRNGILTVDRLPLQRVL